MLLRDRGVLRDTGAWEKLGLAPGRLAAGVNAAKPRDTEDTGNAPRMARRW